jgi:hypothetical protein
MTTVTGVSGTGTGTGTLGVCIGVSGVAGGVFGCAGASVRMMPSGLTGVRAGRIVGFLIGRWVE